MTTNFNNHTQELPLIKIKTFPFHWPLISSDHRRHTVYPLANKEISSFAKILDRTLPLSTVHLTACVMPRSSKISLYFVVNEEAFIILWPGNHRSYHRTNWKPHVFLKRVPCQRVRLQKAIKTNSLIQMKLTFLPNRFVDIFPSILCEIYRLPFEDSISEGRPGWSRDAQWYIEVSHPVVNLAKPARCLKPPHTPLIPYSSSIRLYSAANFGRSFGMSTWKHGHI